MDLEKTTLTDSILRDTTKEFAKNEVTPLDDKTYAKYTEKRNAIIAEFRLKKLKNVGLVLGIGLGIAIVCVLVGWFVLESIPVTVILPLAVVLFSILYARIRVVTINHAKQQKLMEFEDSTLMKNY